MGTKEHPIPVFRVVGDGQPNKPLIQMYLNH